MEASKIMVTPAATWSVPPPSMKSYKIKSNPRGLALIVDIQQATSPHIHQATSPHIQQATSPHTQLNVDADDLKQLLSQLGFTVTIKRNLRQKEMKNVIRDFSQREEHGTADMCVVAVLSHGVPGNEKEVFASDGLPIAKEFILRWFNNENCDDLIGKPKLFILQSRLEESADDGDQSHDGSATASSAEQLTRLRPVWEDMLIAHSYVPQHEGPCFIQCLCEVMSKQAANTNIRDMFDDVTDSLSTSHNDARAVERVDYENRHFVKKLYFNPGLFK